MAIRSAMLWTLFLLAGSARRSSPAKRRRQARRARSSGRRRGWCRWTWWSRTRRATTSTTWSRRISRSGKTTRNSRSRTFRSRRIPNSPLAQQKKLHRAVLRSLDDGRGRPDAGAAGGGEVHRSQCRTGPPDGGREFRRHAADRAELHRRYRAAEAGGQRRQDLGGVAPNRHCRGPRLERGRAVRHPHRRAGAAQPGEDVSATFRDARRWCCSARDFR